MTLEKLSKRSASIRSISLALIFMQHNYQFVMLKFNYDVISFINDIIYVVIKLWQFSDFSGLPKQKIVCRVVALKFFENINIKAQIIHFSSSTKLTTFLLLIVISKKCETIFLHLLRNM